MNIEQYFSFIMITIILLLAPGPSVLLLINNGIKYGAKRATIGVLGNVIAFQFLMILSASGLGAVLSASGYFFSVLKIIGAIYLIYLGFKLWFTSIPKHFIEKSSIQNSPFAIFKEAFFITLSNPKALIFVSALLPQFINIYKPLFPQIIILTLSSALIHFIIYQSYAILSSSAKKLLENPNKKKLFNKISGITFIGFGVALGLSKNRL